MKHTSWVYTPKEINVKRGVAYGLTDLMGGGWNNIVSGVIFAYLTLSVGLNPAMAGAITGVARIFDAIFSLVFGTVTDGFYKTKLGKKYGRRHFWMLVGLVGFAVSFLSFWVPATAIFGPGHDFIYYLVVYTLTELFVGMILIPWETLPTEMTTDYTKRTILSGSRMFISATGTSLVFFILAILQSLPSAAAKKNAYLFAGILWTILFVVAIFISYRMTWERPLTKEFIAELDARPKLSVGQYIKETLHDYAQTFRNSAFRKHLTIYLFSFTGKDFYATLLPTFIVVCMGMASNIPWVLNALAVFGILSTLLAAKLMITHGPRFLYSVSYIGIILALIAYGMTYFLHLKNPMVVLIVITIVYQLSRGILEFTPWNVFPFIPDVDHIMTRDDKAGTYAAVMTFFRKSTGALATWLAGILLEELGYVSTASTQQPGVTDKVALLFMIAPMILIGIALVVSWTFKLNRQTHNILQQEIKRLENGGSKADVTSEARLVAEELTGYPYEKLWPEETYEDAQAEKKKKQDTKKE
ncbi:MFS transporter [Lacticaseibacillus zeae]|uniref:MFS transporter n=1 Tax=Lacticaseibacillus zeae subsp. silagei TaxID=3068307 RepID=A0ABD7ZA09_LACZE|nr:MULTISPECIES: MFS transporter [Lacticaseibacillus]MDE3316210.1 MFS transporter [Lacticaseibacillus zeae]OFR98491.1 MFS transporter [Lactobacillus sp. HMSC068F07]WLV83741.1 MFS transporter [Lacticaseibacillus sp. NCIMB 15475]WLV86497.1 MFS transporter [Lacticaseibacillus sp. NCIMB 15474]